MKHLSVWCGAEAEECRASLVDTAQGCVRALLESGGNARRTAPGVALVLPEVFDVLEALGAELMRVVGPIRDLTLSPD